MPIEVSSETHFCAAMPRSTSLSSMPASVGFNQSSMPQDATLSFSRDVIDVVRPRIITGLLQSESNLRSYSPYEHISPVTSPRITEDTVNGTNACDLDITQQHTSPNRSHEGPIDACVPPTSYFASLPRFERHFERQ